LDWHQEWMNEIHQQMNAVFQEHFGWWPPTLAAWIHWHNMWTGTSAG
jgi:hypothetical protein